MSLPGATVDEPGTSPLVWTYDPWAEHRGRAFAAVLGSAGLIAIAYGLRLPLPMLFVLTLSVFALLAPGFLPTTCSVDARGVSRRIGTLPASMRPWTSIRAAALSPRGLHVSSRDWSAPLSALQQMWLPVPRAADESAVRARLRLALTEHGY